MIASPDAIVMHPARPNGGGIVLGMSVWGLVPDLHDWAGMLAELGYLVVAPNLYRRAAPGHALEYDMRRLEDLVPLMASVSDEVALADLTAAADGLRAQGCARIGAVGWCFGGRIVGMAAATPAVDAVVAFYPTAFETRLDLFDTLRAPLQIHLPEHERFATTDDSVVQIARAAGETPLASAYIYSGAGHGFEFRPPHPAYDANAARLAAVRACSFLERHLHMGKHG